MKGPDAEPRLIEAKLPVARLSQLVSKEKLAMKPVYQMHTWFARRAGSEFRAIILATFLSSSVATEEFWRYFYRHTDLSKLRRPPLVVDPFMGGGTTLVEGLRLGCRVVGVELNPVAWFLVKKEVEPFEAAHFDRALRLLEQTLEPEINKWYSTYCPACRKEARVIRSYWVRVVKCERCNEDVPLFQYSTLSRVNKQGWIYCWNCRKTIAVPPQEGPYVEECPQCKRSLEPISNGRWYHCPNCRHAGRVIQAARRINGLPRSSLYAIQYECPSCRLSGVKAPDDHDFQLYERCGQHVREVQIEALDAPIRYGEESKRILAYGFSRFRQLFNDRQLLILSRIRNSIEKLDVNEGVRELLLLALSDCLEFNNILVPWIYVANKVESCFSIHNYIFAQMYAEINAWDGGRGSFLNAVEKVKRGKVYCAEPFERELGQRVYLRDSCEGTLVNSFQELVEGKGNTLLANASSDNLSFIPDESVDAVITDPPYFDNIIYSGLSDIFYVWLRDHLSKSYPCFQDTLTPRDNEMVVDPSRPEKSPETYVQGLTRVFLEAKRILRNDGLLVFTFHHARPEGWVAVFKALLEGGFLVRATWPIRSEARSYPHTQTPGAALYDAVVVCRKRLATPIKATWKELEPAVIEESLKLLERMQDEVGLTGMAPLTIVAGKALKIYSEHYPLVYEGDSPASVERAMGNAVQIASELVGKLEEKHQPRLSDF